MELQGIFNILKKSAHEKSIWKIWFGKKKISFYSNSGKEHEPTSQGMKHMLMVCVNGAFEQAAIPN